VHQRRPHEEEYRKVRNQVMLIQVNTDGHLGGSEQLTAHVRGTVDVGLKRFVHQISRVEVHLSDQNGNKPGQITKRCMLEARVLGLPPSAVSHAAATFDQAIEGAIDKLKRSLERTSAKLEDRR
jgi:ribosome-associated translation inhibitor RaiA